MSKRYATSEDWEPHRQVIAQLYREQGKTLQETIDYMAREHNFFATPRMFKTRLRKWGLFKYRTGLQIQEEDICSSSRSCHEPNRASGSMAGNDPCELQSQNQDLANMRRYVGCQSYWNQNTGLCVEFPDTSSGIGENLWLEQQRRRLATRKRRLLPLLSIPEVLCAPCDLQRLEEASRIANNYIQGSIESGAWTYDGQLHGIFGPRGLEGWEETFTWLGRLVEGLQYIQCARRTMTQTTTTTTMTTTTTTTREGFRLLNACLDETAARLRYQDSTTMYYFLVFTLIQNQPIRRALIRHVRELAKIVLGSRHPFTLVFERLAWREEVNLSNASATNICDSTATPGRFTELIGVKHSFFDRPLRLCPALSSNGGDAGAGATAAAVARETYASTVVGADAGYGHVLAALQDPAKLIDLARTLRSTIWQNDNDPGDPIGSIIGFDLLLSVGRGLRLHGELAEAALTLETVGRWLSAIDPDVAGRKMQCYLRELKELKELNQGMSN